MSPRSQQDFFAGLLFTVLGGGFAWGATTYQVGKAASMGPGYFPLLLGIILALMGMAIVAKSFMSGAPAVSYTHLDVYKRQPHWFG